MSDHAEGPLATDRSTPSLVIGIGASAGGLDACQRFLEGVPVDQGMAIIIVLHLAPAQESQVARILQKATRMAVTQVLGSERVEPNHVYVIAPGTSLRIVDGSLAAGAPEEPHYLARPIDAFFAALATDQKERAVGIVLSGTGNDGAAGLRAISSAGGLCLIQSPETAEYAGMPRSAIDTGAADTVAPPEEMGRILEQYAAAPRLRPVPREAATGTGEEPAEGLAAILAQLARRYRVDFRDYRKGTLERRTTRRIELLRLSGWQAYRAYLEANPDEVDQLYSDLLIGVTSFFRDPEEWQLLARDILPSLVAERGEAAAVRVWSAGCATGEEAYGLALLFLEHLSEGNDRPELKLFASDASDSALAIARRGLYPAGIAAQVSAPRLDRFFHPAVDGFEVERSLRNAVTFAGHDLLSDPPFARLDLVSCRNVLIYLEPPAQERLIELFHFALRPQGILWLGAAETIGRRTDLFAEVAGQHRFYRALGVPRPGRYHLTRRAPTNEPQPDRREAGTTAESPKSARLLERLVLQRYTSPCVVIDQRLEILYFYGPTDEFLTQPQGEAKLDLLSWVRPELYAKLRSGLAEAVEQRREVTMSAVRLEPGNATARVEIVIAPVTSVPGATGLLLVAFRQLPALDAVATDGASAIDAPLAGPLRQELQDTREELQAAVDQLRTASEEHSASYEELLSLNEELQSSNEELEASKEELQSLNEELTTINRQLEERNVELRSLTADLNNLLVSANLPTIFLDRELRIRRFTPASAAIAHLLPTDVGRALPDLELRVRDARLLADARQVLAAPVPLAAEVATDDGHWYLRNILPYRTQDGTVDGVCLTFHEITAMKQAAAANEYARLYAEAIIRTSRTPLLVLDMEHRVVSANAAFYTTFQINEAKTEGRRIYELGNGQWDIPRVRVLLEQALRQEPVIRDYEVEHLFERIGWRSMRLNADVMQRNGRPDLILVSIEDVTDLRHAEMMAKSRADDLAQDDRRKDEFLAMLGHELRNPLAALTNGLELLRLTGGSSVEEIRAMMERQTRRMTAMLDQLLDVARVVSGKFELKRDAADVAEAANAAIESVKPLIDAAGHELTVSLPSAGTVLVLGDSVRLAQVIENLLGNAAKYTEDGGRIWLSIAATETTVRLSVRDTGIGMEAGVLEHIFDLFTQATPSLHRAKGGLGLGLPLVRSLVQMHGGQVQALSAGPGQGTEVVVTVPRLRRGRLQTADREPAAPPPVTPRRILVVEDEADAAHALVKILTIHGHQARAVPDGDAAIALLGELDPEVVFLDLGLPRMNGYEVARRLRATLGPRVLLVALTGYQADPGRLHAAGFDLHRLKPTQPEKLFALLAELDRRNAKPGQLAGA